MPTASLSDIQDTQQQAGTAPLSDVVSVAPQSAGGTASLSEIASVEPAQPQPAQPQPSTWDKINHIASFVFGTNPEVTQRAAEQFEKPGVKNKLVGGLEYLVSGVPWAGAKVAEGMEAAGAGEYKESAIDTATGAALGLGLPYIGEKVVGSILGEEASRYLPEMAEALRAGKQVVLAHSPQSAIGRVIADAPAAHVVESDAQRPAVNAAVDAAAKAGRAAIVDDSAAVPTVSTGDILAAHTQELLAVEDILKSAGIDPADLKTPEDVQAALGKVSKLIGEHTDPRILAHISLPAQRQLAASLGMTTDELLARESGRAYNAEQAIAARNLLQASQSNLLLAAKSAAADSGKMGDFTRALSQHALVQDSVMGMRAEAGRALGSFRVAEEELPAAKISKALSKIAPTDKNALKTAADLLSKLDTSDERAVNRFVREVTPSSTVDKIKEYYINALLSSPKVVLVKAASESLQMALEAMRMGVSGALSKAKSVLTGAPQEQFTGEAYWFARGAWQAIRDIPKVLTGKIDVAAMMPGFESTGTRAIKGKLGEIARLPGTVISRQTNAVWLLNYRGALNALAARAGLAEGLEGDALAQRVAYLAENPTQSIAAQAREFAMRSTFQEEFNKATVTGRAALATQRFISTFPGMKFIAPFFHVPTTLVKRGLEYSPAGLLDGTVKGDTDAIARGLIGSSIAAGVAWATHAGYITGGGPLDYRKRYALQDTGWTPYSVKIGDRYYNVHRAEPLGFAMGLVADATLALERDADSPQAQSQAHEAVRYIARNLDNLPFFETMSNVVESIGSADPLGSIGRFARFQAGSFVPAVIRNVARAEDRTIRQPKTLAQGVEANVPGLTRNVPAALDTSGEPVKHPASALGGVNPFPVSSEKHDAAMSEIARLGLSAIQPPRTVSLAGEKVRPTEDEARQLQQTEQRMLYNWLSGLVGSEDWTALSDDTKQKVIERFRREIAGTRTERLLQIRRSREQGAEPSHTAARAGQHATQHIAKRALKGRFNLLKEAATWLEDVRP